MSTTVCPTTYEVTLTESGKWLHAQGSDFLFTYIDDSWTNDLKHEVAEAFTQALKMSSVIKQAVLDTSGKKVENGLYVVDQDAMTTAMNSIPGMGEVSVDSKEESGQGTAASINLEFFTSILAGLNGDLAPILTYLNQEMSNLQVQTQQSQVDGAFGTVLGLISVMPELDVVVTTFQYAFSSTQTAEWFTRINCGSAEHYSYDYKYMVVSYNYDPSS